MEGKISERAVLKRGGPWIHLQGSVEGKVSDTVIFEEGLSLGSLWRERFQKHWSLERGFHWVYLQGNMEGQVSEGKKSSHKRGMVIGRGFIHKEIWRERFQGRKKKTVIKRGWSLITGSTVPKTAYNI